MPDTFIQWLIAGLIGLLFARDLVYAVLKKKGLINGEKKDFTDDICELSKHAKVANEEMGEIKERLTALETKMDILLKHFKI